MPDSNTIKILDADCSVGTILYFIKNNLGDARRYIFYGVDISAKFIEIAKTLNSEANFQFQVCDLQNPLPFEDDFFDNILCLDVLEHIK